MRQGKPYILFTPCEVKADIQKYFSRNLEIYYFVIHEILNRSVHDKNYNIGDFTPINVKKIKRVINKEPAYYIRNLKKYDILISDKKYQQGTKSMFYKLNPRYKIDNNIVKIEPGTLLYKGLQHQQRNTEKNRNKLPDHLQTMHKKFLSVDYDIKKAYKWINTIKEPEKSLTYSMAVEQLNDKRTRYFKRNNRNKRLDTNLTNLKKELRPFLIGNYTEIDLKNSQPFFLSVILNHIITNIHHNDTLMFDIMNINLVNYFGIQLFRKVENVVKKESFRKIRHFEMLEKTKKGLFYEDFQSELKLTRDEVKTIMFGVLYSRNEYYEKQQRFIPYRKEKRLFAERYGLEYEIIKILKSKQYQNLAVFMQRVESKLFIDKIAPELVKNGIVPFTVHDSVIIESRYQLKALSIIKNIFQLHIGVVPSLNVKVLSVNENKKTMHERRIIKPHEAKNYAMINV